jgi:hypothetical protein
MRADCLRCFLLHCRILFGRFKAPPPSPERFAVGNVVLTLARCKQSYHGHLAFGQPWAQLGQRISRMDEQQRAGARTEAAKRILRRPQSVAVKNAPSYTLLGLVCAMVNIAHTHFIFCEPPFLACFPRRPFPLTNPILFRTCPCPACCSDLLNLLACCASYPGAEERAF